MPERLAASAKSRRLPGRNVAAPLRSACTSLAARSNTRPSSLTRSILFGLLSRCGQLPGLLCSAFRKRETPAFVYARKVGKPCRRQAISALSPYPLQRLAKRFAGRDAAGVLGLPRKLADRKVRLLLAGASSTEGYPPYFHHRPIEAWVLCLASHLARSRDPT